MNFKIEKWHDIPEACYKLMYGLAKERFEEYASESEVMTTRSIKMLTSIVVVISIVIGDSIKNLHVCYISIILTALLILSAIEFYLLFKLISPKLIKYRGLSPEMSVPEYISDEENKTCKIQLTYYSVLKTLQSNIDSMTVSNTNRIEKYKISLKLLFAILIGSGLLIGLNLTYPL